VAEGRWGEAGERVRFVVPHKVAEFKTQEVPMSGRTITVPFNAPVAPADKITFHIPPEPGTIFDPKAWRAEIDEALVESFKDDLIDVYAKHGLSLSHEDGHGSFIIEPYRSEDVKWLRAAIVSL
jgi:hypothetical protein